MTVIRSFSVFVFLLFPVLGFSDAVSLKNGDRVQGLIWEMGEGKLKIVTESMGELQIERAAIFTIATDSYVFLQLEEGSVIKAILLPGNTEGEIIVELADLKSRSLAKLSSIKSIHRESSEILSGDSSSSGNVSLGVSGSSGNTDSAAVVGEFEIIHAFSSKDKIHDSIRFFGDYKYSESKGEMDSRRGSFSVRYNGKIWKNLLWYLSENLSFNAFQDLKVRTEEAVGFSFPVWSSSALDLNFKFGLARVDSSYKDGENIGYFSLPLSWILKWRIMDRLLLKQEMEFLPSMDSLSNYLLRLNTKLQVPFTKNWSFDIKDGWIKTSPPPKNKKKTDHHISMRICYSF